MSRVSPKTTFEDLTRAQLLARRNAGTLEPCKYYRVTNPPAVTNAPNATVVMLALKPDELSTNGWFESDADEDAWDVVFDLDQNQYSWIKATDYENEIRGHAQIRAFPYANPDVREVRLDEATFQYQSGVMRGVEMKQGALVQLRGGTINDTTIGHAARITAMTGGLIQNSFIGSRSEITSMSGGTITSLVMHGYGRLAAMSGGAINYTVISGGSYVALTGSAITINYSLFTSLSRAYLQNRPSGTVTDLTVANRGYVYARTGAAINISSVEVSDYGRLYLDNSAILLSRSSWTNYGYSIFTNSTGSVYDMHVTDNGNVYARNATGIIVRQVSLENNGYINIDGAAGFDVRYCSFRDFCRLFNRNGTGMRFWYSTMESGGYWLADANIAGQRLYYNTIQGRGYLDTRNSGVWIDSCTVADRSQINTRNATAAGSAQHRIFGCTLTSYGRLLGNNANFLGSVQYSEVDTGSILYVDQKGAGAASYIKVQVLGRLSLDFAGACSGLICTRFAQVQTAPVNNTRFGI